MELINTTGLAAGYNIGLEPNGRELLVVVIKGTFRIPQPGEFVRPFAISEQQLPLVMADTFSGEPGRSAPLYEVDFAPRKPHCDILINGSAYAPNGEPTTRVEAGIQIGSWKKRIAVIGPRHWDCSLASMCSTPPQPFIRVPISYDVAFGGTDLRHQDPAHHAVYLANPVGLGFYKNMNWPWVDGAPLPLTEELDSSVIKANNNYRPMSFGPVGRSWEPRFRFGGTYDDEWLTNHFPFLPPDFDERYFQAAPDDQQVPLGFFDGGAEVLLSNLTPEGLARFEVPHFRVTVTVVPKAGSRENYVAVMDTVTIEPDKRRFSLVWRIARPLRFDLFEIARVHVNGASREPWKQQENVLSTAPLDYPQSKL